jgi:hypothetical protein
MKLEKHVVGRMETIVKEKVNGGYTPQNLT